ncbi:MAG: transketolase C-terminal domain-containing protein, partial [Candidatus Micrarchaeota archaeon]|nr:transketolase C-terminal domain-containing protein [Candidatus Micrarchaeota archaeon]
PFEIGKANILRDGSDVCIAATGVMVYYALVAAETLSKKGISAEVANHHTLKPFDAKQVVKSARKCGALVTAEEHQKFGGLRAACAEVLGEQQPVPLQYVAVEDTFGESGKPDLLLKKYGLTAEHVVKKAEAAVKMKGR